jgi:O-antigen/teichoic acid export membrane protein
MDLGRPLQRPDAETGVASDAANTREPDEARIAERRPRSIAQGGFESVLSRIVVLFCLVALVIVTGRLMEPAGRGLYALATVAASLCGLPLGAVWVANAVEIARRRATLAEILGGSMVIALVGGLAVAVVAVAISPLLGDRWWLVALPAAVTPFMLLSRYQEGLYTGVGHVRAVNRIRIARAALPLAFITPPLLAGASAKTAIAIWVLWWVALPVVLFFPVRSLAGRARLPREHGFYRRVVSYGVKISGLNAVTMFNDRVGLLALAAFASDADVGIYSIAIAGTQALLLVTEALTLSAFQRIGASSRTDSAALTARTIRHAVLMAAVGGVLLVPITFIAVPLTVGEEYSDVPLLLAILIPTAIGSAAFLPLYAFFEVQIATASMRLKVAGSALLGSVALSVALAPVWGRWGVAVGTSLAYVIASVVAFRCFRAESGSRLRDLRPGRGELRDYLALARTYSARWSRAS